MRQAYDYWQDQPGNYHQRSPSQKTHYKEPPAHTHKSPCPARPPSWFPIRYETLVRLAPWTICVATRSPDQTEIRIRAHDAPAWCGINQPCRRAPSPLLAGPFLMSPRRRQSATPGPLPASPRHQVGSVPRSAVHGCLRGSYEARSPPGAFLRKPPAGLLATGCRVFLLTEYPYDPLVRRPTPSLDSRRPPEILQSGYCNRPADTPA